MPVTTANSNDNSHMWVIAAAVVGGTNLRALATSIQPSSLTEIAVLSLFPGLEEVKQPWKYWRTRFSSLYNPHCIIAWYQCPKAMRFILL